jgi:hypothetical protein
LYGGEVQAAVEVMTSLVVFDVVFTVFVNVIVRTTVTFTGDGKMMEVNWMVLHGTVVVEGGSSVDPEIVEVVVDAFGQLAFYEPR